MEELDDEEDEVEEDVDEEVDDEVSPPVEVDEETVEESPPTQLVNGVQSKEQANKDKSLLFFILSNPS